MFPIMSFAIPCATFAVVWSANTECSIKSVPYNVCRSPPTIHRALPCASQQNHSPCWHFELQRVADSYPASWIFVGRCWLTTTDSPPVLSGGSILHVSKYYICPLLFTERPEITTRHTCQAPAKQNPSLRDGQTDRIK